MEESTSPAAGCRVALPRRFSAEGSAFGCWCFVILSALLAACGGGGGGGGGPSVATPQGDDPAAGNRIVLSAPNRSNGANYKDAEFRANYGLEMIKADAAYQRGYWGQGATVALLDTGVRTTHIDLAANLIDGLGYIITRGGTITTVADNTGHGTYAAGIIGGVRDGARFHGVAPSVKIMPLRPDENRSFDGSGFVNLIRHAAQNNVHILHNGFNFGSGVQLLGEYNDGATRFNALMCCGADMEAILSSPLGRSFRAVLASAVAPLANEDIAVVTPANSSGWHSGGEFPLFSSITITFPGRFTNSFYSTRSYTPENIIRHFAVTAAVTVSVSDDGMMIVTTTTSFPSIRFYDPLTFTVDGAQTVIRLDPNSPGGAALAPIYHRELLGRWLAVAAVNSETVITRTSNGCGHKSKYWCLVAPGDDYSPFAQPGALSITSAGVDGDMQVTTETGRPTESAAAHVSGALALLKSRFPNMPMSVLAHILLSTATDLGTTGIDDIYGHGLVNIERAITVQGAINVVLPNIPVTSPTLPGPPPSDGINYRTAEFNRNWGLGAINADAAYQRGFWGQGVTVAVADTGARTSHNDLAANITPGRRFNPIGETLMFGADEDPHGHGTHVAGIVAGVRDGERFHGVAPSVKIMPLRLQDNSGDFNGRAAAAFHYAASQNVHIINNSWGEAPLTMFGRYSGPASRSGTYFFRMPWTEAAMALPLNAMASIRGEVSALVEGVEESDTAVVFAVGNGFWNKIISNQEVCYNGYDATGNCHNHRNNFRANPLQITAHFVISRVSPSRDGFGTLPSDITLSQPFTVTVDGSRTVLRWEDSSPDVYALAPIWHPTVLGRWMAVAALQRSGNGYTLARFSNGCGEKAKRWCLSAPGDDIYSGHSDSDTSTATRSGTSMGAPHVSGALALLKSRLTGMPMSVIVAILLSTATDLGASGVDDVYGHGLVNISAAITAQSAAQIAGRSGVFLKDARAELPLAFSGFAEGLRGVSVAVRYLDSFYYDAPIHNLIDAQEKAKMPTDFAAQLWNVDGGDGYGAIGNGVGGGNSIGGGDNGNGLFAFADDGELRAVGIKNGAFQLRHNRFSENEVWGGGYDLPSRPFFANGNGKNTALSFDFGGNFRAFAARGGVENANYRQLGMQWRQSFSRLGIAAGLSQVREEDSLFGGKFGGALPLFGGGRARQTDVFARYALDNRGVWNAFASYQRADVEADVGGIVGDISGIVSEGWKAGFSARDWLRGGDAFRFSFGRDAAITQGKALLRYAKSANPQMDENTQVVRNHSFEMIEREIDVSSRSPLVFSVGYGYAPFENSRLSFGVMHRLDGDSAFSLDWRVRF